MKRFVKRTCWILLSIFILGLLMPQHLQMPVEGANSHSYNPQSFWYGGWGSSVVHKGVDIFARRGTPVHSSTIGLVLSTADYGKGGKFVVILGPKWRIHYYAHLNEIKTSAFSFVNRNSIIGTVGNTGNAATTPSHLHYSIATMFPYPWRITNETQGIRKMFYLNPIDYLKDAHPRKQKSKNVIAQTACNENKKVDNMPGVREGDIIFQTSKSSQSKYIQIATHSRMSHCGIIVKVGNQYKVLEASNVVKLTPLSQFIAKGKDQKYWIRSPKQKDIKISYQKYLGKRYDTAFKLDNSTYYCSELVYDIYKKQLGIELCTPRKVSSYLTFAMNDILERRGIDTRQLVVAPSDLYRSDQLE